MIMAVVAAPVAVAAASKPATHTAGDTSMLTFIEEIGRSADYHRVGLFRCDCGKTTKVAISRVRTGYTRSCGCLIVQARKNNIKHGMHRSPEWHSWQAMLARCCRPTHKDYPRWGAVGITVYDEWKTSFEAFYTHIGPRPKGKTLDRIDPLLGYEPGNVRWATPKQQARNRKRPAVQITTSAGVMFLADYAASIGITTEAARQRLKRNKLEGCYAYS